MDGGDFRRSRLRRLSHPYSWRPREISVLRRARLYPGTGVPRANGGLHRPLHVDRVVIVTPSVYGTDNSATLFGMKARRPTTRGVSVIHDETPDGDLERMTHAAPRAD